MTNKFQVNIHALDNFTPTFDSLNKQAQKAHESVSKVSVESKRWLGNMSGGLAQTQKQLQVPTSSIDALKTLWNPTAFLAGISAAAAGLGMLTNRWAGYSMEVMRSSSLLSVNAESLQAWRAASRLAGGTAEGMTATFHGLGQTLQDAKFGRNPVASMLMRGMSITTAQNADGSINVERTMAGVQRVMQSIRDPLTRRVFASAMGLPEEAAYTLGPGGAGRFLGQARGVGAVLNADQLSKGVAAERGIVSTSLKAEALGRDVGGSALNPAANLAQRLQEYDAANANAPKMTDEQAQAEADALRGRFLRNNDPRNPAGAASAAGQVNIDLTVPPGARVKASSNGPALRVRRTGPGN